MIPKFRAWDKELKQIIYEVLEISFRDRYIIWKNGKYTEQSHFYEIELMQYTGLTDKNGKEIYEGDILRLKNSLYLIDYNALIIFKDGGFCAIDGTEDNYAVSRYRLSDFDLEITVLGNIYEDPELLEENEK